MSYWRNYLIIALLVAQAPTPTPLPHWHDSTTPAPLFSWTTTAPWTVQDLPPRPFCTISTERNEAPQCENGGKLYTIFEDAEVKCVVMYRGEGNKRQFSNNSQPVCWFKEAK